MNDEKMKQESEEREGELQMKPSKIQIILKILLNAQIIPNLASEISFNPEPMYFVYMTASVL